MLFLGPVLDRFLFPLATFGAPLASLRGVLAVLAQEATTKGLDGFPKGGYARAKPYPEELRV